MVWRVYDTPHLKVRVTRLFCLAISDLVRRTLRYRNLLVRQMVQMKNKIAVLLMEAGVSYNKQRLHKAG